MFSRSARRGTRRALVSVLAAALGVGVLSVPSAHAADPYLDRLAEAAATPALNWADCEDGFQCSTAQVPLDYNSPHGEQIDLAVIKLPAADPGQRIGTLFVNFGGPGPSGVDRLRERARWPWLFSPELRARFDLVSWDPRGVSRSAGAHCFAGAEEQEQYLGSFPGTPTDPRDEPEFFARSADIAARCGAQAGPILAHASTANTARDLDLLRRAVGDATLTYHGISYGTQVGAVYANMFPGRVRAMAFDGSLDFEGNADGHGADGANVPLDTRQGVAVGIAETFDAFLRDCSAAGPRCAFSAGDPKLKWLALAERARLAPIMLDGTPWTFSHVVSTAGSLSRPETYPDLAVLLQNLFDAATTLPARVPDALFDKNYPANRVEAFYTIQCADSTVPTDPAAYSRIAAAEDLHNPYFGRTAVFNAMPCAFWPTRDLDRYTGPWNRETAAPILVLNSRYDPATPLHGAYAGATQLARAQVVVLEGAGHSSMYVPSTCAEHVKRDYLFTGQLPPNGTRCGIDHSPFA
ncbi:alpha/beta hydrolase [Nocardia neocaledoniensis]|uniref:alpha/beta hydrolase n=1 Tax=Nocardia neocaledoniensis TaxID=236511 RepID=UPI0024542FA2|nr:alpha/beta hydrolase [Nocardia neocaledoniensis]